MHAELSEMELRIVARLNEEIGKDASQLHRASHLVSHYKKHLQVLSQTVGRISIYLDHDFDPYISTARLRGSPERVLLQNRLPMPATGLREHRLRAGKAGSLRRTS